MNSKSLQQLLDMVVAIDGKQENTQFTFSTKSGHFNIEYVPDFIEQSEDVMICNDM